MLEKVKFINQREAEKMPGWDSGAMISITQPHGVQANLMAGWYAIHRVTFHDVDPVNNPVNPKKIRFPITAEQAIEIVRFVNEISPVVKTLIVHCGGGISRSAAISKWIAMHYGLTFEHEYDRYNKFVFDQLAKAANQQKDALE